MSVESNLVSLKDIIPANLNRSSLIISCIFIFRFAMFKCNSGIPFNTVLKRGGGISGNLFFHSLCISAAACSDTKSAYMKTVDVQLAELLYSAEGNICLTWCKSTLPQCHINNHF